MRSQSTASKEAIKDKRTKESALLVKSTIRKKFIETNGEYTIREMEQATGLTYMQCQKRMSDLELIDGFLEIKSMKKENGYKNSVYGIRKLSIYDFNERLNNMIELDPTMDRKKMSKFKLLDSVLKKLCDTEKYNAIIDEFNREYKRISKR